MVKPRIALTQSGNSSLGSEGVAFCREHGLELDEEQAYVLEESLKMRGDRWASYEVGLNVPRQNGKGVVQQGRELVEIYLVKSELTIHSAHLHNTSLTHLRRLWALIESNEELLSEVKQQKYGRLPYWTTGQERIEFTGGRMIEFRTRTAGGARGLSCDLLVLDEAMFLPESALAASFFTGSARPNPQVWYAGSAVDQLIHPDGVVWARVRERGMEGDPSLTYFEWSVEGENPSGVPRAVLEDKAAWAQANFTLGRRIPVEHVEKEYRSLGKGRAFAVERLGIGDWPRTDHVSTNPIDLELWAELEDRAARFAGRKCIGVDVSPERRGAIVASGMTSDDRFLTEIVEERNGTGWIPGRLAELKGRHDPVAIVADGRGPVSSLMDKFEELGLDVEFVDAGEHARACGRLVDVVNERKLAHLGQSELDDAVQAASTRPLGDAWAWSRRNSSGNISPLVAATLALSAAIQHGDREWAASWA